MADASFPSISPPPAEVSLLERLHPDLLSLVYSFVPQLQQLRSLSHINRHLSSLLSPVSFRASLLIDDHLMTQLPSLPFRPFNFLCAATSVSVRYGAGARMEWPVESNLFSTTSSRSLLHFSSITRLSLRFTATWDFLYGFTPIDLFTGLLHSAQPNCDVFPHLHSLRLHGVPECEEVDRHWQSLSRLTRLTSLHLSAFAFASLTKAELLLSPPALRTLDVRQCQWSLPEGEEAEWQRMARQRGVKLQGCGQSRGDEGRERMASDSAGVGSMYDVRHEVS
jgi:hypothetical protein